MFDITSIVPTGSAEMLPALTGPVGGDPVGLPQPGSAVPSTSRPADAPASERSSRRSSRRLQTPPAAAAQRGSEGDSGSTIEILELISSKYPVSRSARQQVPRITKVLRADLSAAAGRDDHTRRRAPTL